MTIRLSALVLLVGILLAACSVEASDSPPAPEPTATRAAPTIQVDAPVPPAMATTTAPEVANAPTTAPTKVASAISTAVPTVEPAAQASLIQIASGRCCVSAFWHPDSDSVLFIDKPDANSQTAIYRLPIDGSANAQVWNQRIAFYTNDLGYAINPEPAGTLITRLSDGAQFRIRNGGRNVNLSPDRTQLVWTETRETFPAENRLTNVMIANLDGTNARRLTQVLRGGVSGWLDNNRLLLTGRRSLQTDETTLFAYNVGDGAQTELASAERLRQTTVSRDASWVAYTIANNPKPELNGMWVVRTDGTARKKLDLYGAMQWRDGSRLVIAPLDLGAPTHRFVEYDANTGETRPLTPADGPAFKIASGDWSISPDGNKIVFLNAADHNLWLWQLP